MSLINYHLLTSEMENQPGAFGAFPSFSFSYVSFFDPYLVLYAVRIVWLLSASAIYLRAGNKQILTYMYRNALSDVCGTYGPVDFYGRRDVWRVWGVFRKQEFIVTDLSNFKVEHLRIYKRLDHFKEVLSQFQGKEGKDIPKELVEQIRGNINKDKGTTTLSDVKQSLRTLELNKYVENIISTTC